MHENLKKGDIILLPLSYSDLVTEEVRPALVLHHDLEEMQLVVAYITTQIKNPPGPFGKQILKGTSMYDKSGLQYDSMLRINWVMTVKRILVYKKIGDADEELRRWINQAVPKCFLM
jgi:hypothetical protein